LDECDEMGDDDGKEKREELEEHMNNKYHLLGHKLK
jgi:hypothetical protein